ncbi:MAG: nuclear transport factor 2 family protein, partial [Pseudomonadota bacterium]
MLGHTANPTDRKALSMRALILSLVFAVSLPFAALGDTTNPIIARMTAFVEAYNAQNVPGILSFYAPDAVLMAPGQRSIVGHEAIGKHYAQAFAAG